MHYNRTILLVALLAPSAGWVSNTAYAQIGTLDSQFDGTGTATHPIQDWGRAQAVSLAPDGSVIAIGHAETNGNGDTREGIPILFDPSGNVEGTHTYPNSSVFGCGQNTLQIAITVLRPDGTLDPAFGVDGTTVFEYGVGPIDIGRVIDIDPAAERIAVAGESGEIDPEDDRFWEIAAARLIGFSDAIFADRFE